MEYKKEKELIVAYDNRGQFRGSWNILTNEFKGCTNTPAKSVPKAFSEDTLMHSRCRYFTTALYNIFRCIKEYSLKEYLQRANRIEQLISLNLHFETNRKTWNFLLCDTTPLVKDVVNFLNVQERGLYSAQGIVRYYALQDYEKFKAYITPENELWAKEYIDYVNRHMIDLFSRFHNIQECLDKQHWFYLYGARALKEKADNNYGEYNLYCDANRYYNWLKEMNEPIQVPHFVLSSFAILTWRYSNWKNEHYDELLQMHNDNKELYFETDKFIIRPLLSKADFHIEAEVQHNCVESIYMERVAEGKTYVLTVRHKDAPDTPYITCEVTKEYTVEQFYLARNRSPQLAEDILLADKYQEYLRRLRCKKGM